MRLTTTNFRRLQLKNQLLWFGIFTFAAAVVWMTYSIFSTYQKSSVDSQIEGMRTPLNPSLNIELIDKLKLRIAPQESFAIPKPIEPADTETSKTTSSTPKPTPPSSPNPQFLRILLN